MNAESFAALSRMLDYPSVSDGLKNDCALVSAHLAARGLDPGPVVSFGAFAVAEPLAALQESYVATFDFNPATSPYLGYHLFGDNPKKGGYLIMLKQEYARCGYVPTGKELPDHLAVLLGFLAHLTKQGESSEQQRFVAAAVLPGVERLATAFAAREESPWKPLIETARLLCADACQEVSSC